MSTTESRPLLKEDPFRNEKTQRLFEAIDKLRSCGANHDVGLPELVIVGDQSAGKSSLLQSLTDIPFPVADRLCTQFPTRIVSRRTPNQDEVTKISIEPNVFSPAEAFGFVESPKERAKRLKAYDNFTYSRPNITASEFADAMNQAKTLMGVKRVVPGEDGLQTTGTRNFSGDVFKVELSGPDRSYFSILDVPGVFQSLTKGLTEQEKSGVTDMVAAYMKPKQSVIICVASGTNDLANQASFDMASKQDSDLERTIGVITKCDITQHKDQILSLAQNEEKHLKHGWFVVRNRTPSELDTRIDSLERHERERNFFDSPPWSRLPEARRGTQALKSYLADLLCTRIQETFPSILATIQARQLSACSELDRLGTSRETIEEKRIYLTDIAQRLHGLGSQALLGRYNGLSENDLRLRKFVREANDDFAAQMILNGHRVPFLDMPDGPDSRSSPIQTLIREEIKNCRGTELQGTLNPDVLPTLFHRQIANWKGMATTHFQHVTTGIMKMVEEGLQKLCEDNNTTQKIKMFVRRTNKTSEEQGLAQLRRRFDELASRHLQTQNPTFEQNVRKARLARFKKAMERCWSKEHGSIFRKSQSGDSRAEEDHQVIIDLRHMTLLFDELHMSNAQNLEDEIHDTLKSYYELTLHDFIEFVTQQVVESYLNDPRGPVLFFNPVYIGSLGPGAIGDLGAEDSDIIKERAKMQATLTRLNRAEEIALEYT